MLDCKVRNTLAIQSLRNHRTISLDDKQQVYTNIIYFPTIMVMSNGGEVGVDTRSLINYCRRRRVRRESHEYIPDELWFEILSRLPIKSLLISRSVCKLWRYFSFILEHKIETHPLYVPMCALVLLSFTFREDEEPLGFESDDYFYGYFCLRSRENFGIKFCSHAKDFIYSSGFERGLLRNLSFDFSAVHEVIPFIDNQPHTFVLHGGLLLVTNNDGISEAHNPVTKQIHFVPKSPIVEKDGFKHHHKTEIPGLIIQFPCLAGQRCRFIVVRFCMELKMIEVYHSVTRTWKNYPLKLDVETLSLVRWRYQNYVGFFENGVLCLYVLTNKDHGLAMKFKCCKNSATNQYFFPLPEEHVWENGNARIWECEKSLYLSDFDDTSLWIWKAESTQVDAWSWVKILEISPRRKLCKATARQHLLKVVLNASDRVMPLALDPNLPVLYLIVNSWVFAYNLNKDSLEKIGEVKDQEHRGLDYVHTYVPCLGFMEASNDG